MTTPTMQRRGRTPQSERVEATQRKIIDSALNLLREEGLRGTTLQAVARGADVSLGALQHHFESRDALMERLVDELQIRRDLSVPPIVQVMLVLQNEPLEVPRVPGLTLRGRETANMKAVTIRPWVAARGQDDADRCQRMPLNTALIQPMFDHGFDDIHEIGLQQREHRLGFRVPHAGIELQDIGLALHDHQSRIEHTLKRTPHARERVHGRLQDRALQTLDQRLITRLFDQFGNPLHGPIEIPYLPLRGARGAV